MKQYFELKAKHKDALLLFRVGDFYETFGEDAIKASAVLGITLTSRNNGGSDIELAGFPHHSIDVYLPKLVRGGYRVAICEQLEKPSKEKKIVKRGVTDVVTPGIGTHDNLLETKENNYLCSLYIDSDSRSASAFLDLSTGDFSMYEGSLIEVIKLVNTYHPKEIIYSKKDKARIEKELGDAFYLYGLDEWIWQEDYCRDKLLDTLKVTNLKGYGIEKYKLGQIAAGSILHYLDQNQQSNLNHITKISRIKLDQYVWLDQFTIRNLELIYSNHPTGIPLAQILDHTVTAMGARMLRKWIMLPLTDRSMIEKRHEVVDFLLSELPLTEIIDGHLKGISDLERIMGKVALRRANPREVYQLMISLEKLPDLKEALSSSESQGVIKLRDQLNPLQELCETIKGALKEEPPVQTNKGGYIGEGHDEELDRLRNLISNSKGVLSSLVEKEALQTGIANLKVGFNNVFGYYFEVTNKYKDQGLVPEHWTRKQTLTSAERYISEELKKLESEILGAEEKIIHLESQLYDQLLNHVSEFIIPVQQNAETIAELDCLTSFSKLSRRRHYCRPDITDGYEINISEARHPVIEAHLPPGESYIPNDLSVNNEETQIMLITGPNMSGKSAILRQTALICLMAQIGCYVPATAAQIGIVDRIFTRVGASDNISSGESTFMVEMIETSTIMNNLSARSLILLDEIGRGTSTYDGISIAWSIVEYLHQSEVKPKTLFATHYHELSQLSDKYDRIKNYNVATKEIGEKIIFLRKLVEGSTNQSFGIQVAQMSGLPKEIVSRAHQILKSLQEKSVVQQKEKEETLGKLDNFSNEGQLIMFGPDPVTQDVIKELNRLDINTMTPVECMMKLTALIKKIQSTHSN